MFDWHQFHASEHPPPAVVDSRLRLRVCLVGFVLLLVVVFARVVQLEVSQGAAFRSQAAKPLARRQSLPGVRGRILARDGTVLAYDKKVLALAVHYRHLQQQPDPRWLKWAARKRLSPAGRKDPARLREEQSRVRAEQRELHRRLARLCGLSDDQWARRARQVEARVERIVESVNRRSSRQQAAGSRQQQPASSTSLGKRIGSLALDVLQASVDDVPPAPVVAAEELDYHVMAEDVPLEVVAEVEANPRQYPGVKIITRARRAYPAKTLAAHVLGHLGPIQKDELAAAGTPDGYRADDRIGRLGLEQRYESILRGHRGAAVELTDHSGRVMASYRRKEPGVGRDLVLTIDPQLQQAAEDLLDSALKRRAIQSAEADADPAGGAIVVMDVHSGAVLAAASAPRFDPNLFAGDRSGELESLLSDPAHPLFDRVAKMAVPPGSVFKMITAVALLEQSAIADDEPFLCRGYLNTPDRRRCAVYIRRGVGHGEVTLADAVAVSCNVYFFHHAGQMGPDPLVDWASRFGMGRLTGVDLPGESAGVLPTPRTIRRLEGHRWRTGDTQSLAIGQGSLCATPLQIVRLTAAIANGGQLVTPHLVSGLGLPELTDGQSTVELGKTSDDPIDIPPPQPIPGLQASTLTTIREGLERVVSDPDGTAHGTVYLESIPIAGKTGTAQTGAAAHGWFAGYVPADRPKLAFVVVLEHSGAASTTAGPVARRLVLRMQELGHLGGR